MAKVKGIGGVFFRSSDPKALGAWYAEHLGVPLSPYGHAKFPWKHADDTSTGGMTVWKPFPKETEYFGPTHPALMINYIVEDLDACLAELREAGVVVDERVERSEYGNFGWATDPEGNRIELWEPPK
jgi:predicted enzyme related to lactoylglutathione lyase